MIVHISGASGSGKTTLGDRLQKALGDRIKVVDVDRIMDSFISKHITSITSTEQFAESYQKFIDEFITDAKTKHEHIIFVGLNAFVVGEKHYFEDADHNEISIDLPNKYFDLKAEYKFYIELDAPTIIRQMYDRGYIKHIDWFSDWMKKRKDIVYSELIKDEKTAQKDICTALNELFDFTDIRKNIETWDRYYAKIGYVFLPRDKIFEKVIGMIRDASDTKNTKKPQDMQVQDGGFSKYAKYKAKYINLKRRQNIAV